MPKGEFELIRKFFSFSSNNEKTLLVENGDDAAAVVIDPNQALLTCVDTLVAGVHFPTNVPVDSIGHKCLAVNISDIAAMGGTPKWATLALTIPEYNSEWLKLFSAGFFQLADKYGIKLIGGDTTRGPLTISVQLMGVISKEKQLLRSGARVGDKIFVTGRLGEAAIALESWMQEVELNDQTPFFHNRLNYPEPQIQLGEKLLHLASSAIDVSDGLASDLGHVLDKSGVGARIYKDNIPVARIESNIKLPKSALDYALYGGDDYQLCFTASPEKADEILVLSDPTRHNQNITEIGEIVEGNKLILVDSEGEEQPLSGDGYNHFAPD